MMFINEARDEVAELTMKLKNAGLSMDNDAGVLTKESRTISFNSTAAPVSSAASVCSVEPTLESVERISCCFWQDAVWTTEVPARGPDLQNASEEIQRWVELVEECSMGAFEENCLEMVTKKSKFKLAVLSAPSGEFLGFCIYKINRGQGALTIGKIAVSVEYRGQGYGKRMIKEIIKMAKKDKMIHFVSLSALPTAVKFYKRMNFKAFTDVKFTEVLESLQQGETFVEGQVYMEFKVRNAPKGKKR